MKMSKSMKRKLNQSGVVLITVVTIMMMMVVMVTASLNFVQHETTKTYDDYKYKQAFYTASSCLESFISEVTLEDKTEAEKTDEVIAEQKTMLNKLADSGATTEVKITDSGSNDVSNVGTCTITVERQNATTVKVTSICEYLDQSAKVVGLLGVAAEVKPGSFDNALELTGDSSQKFNNVNIVGDVSKIDNDAHKMNTLYDNTSNINKTYGSLSLKGSVKLNNSVVGESLLSQSSSTYYDGCVLSASRSIFITGNIPNFTSSKQKPSGIDSATDATYNYIKAGELFSVQSNNIKIGTSGYEIDVYAGTVIFGNGNNDTFITDIINTANQTYDATTGAVTGSLGAGASQGDSYTQYGNIYAYDVSKYNSSTAFKGDVIFTSGSTKDIINGNIYAEGDVYFYNDNNGPATINGDIYCQGTVYFIDAPNGHKTTVNGTVHCSNVVGTENADVTAYDSTAWSMSSVEDRGKTNWFDDDGDEVDSSGSKVNAETTRPYTYYPEHFLTLDSSDVTDISYTYKSFYRSADVTATEYANADGSAKTGYEFRGSYVFDKNNNRMVLNPDKKASLTIDNYKTDYTDEYGTSYKYKVTGSCIIPASGSDITSSGHTGEMIYVEINDSDIVLVVENGVTFAQRDHIIVNNKSDYVDDDGVTQYSHFLYIVPDVGVGTAELFDEDAVDENDPDTYAAYYDNDSFADCTFTFENQIVADYETYYNSGLSGSSNYINASDDKDYTEDGITGTTVSRGGIIMLLTEKTTVNISNQNFIQATIYGPKASFNWGNNVFDNFTFIPKAFISSGTLMKVGIFGMAIVSNFQASANNFGILYQKVSDGSILRNARIAGSSSTGYQFLQYKRY